MKDQNAPYSIMLDFFKSIFREVLLEAPQMSGDLNERSHILQRKEYLSPKEVEQFFSLNANTLASWRSQGKGPAYSKEGSLIMYSKTDVEEFLKKRRIKTNDQRH